MQPLDVREWLQARRLAGCDYADHLLDLVEGEDEADENAAMLEDLAKLMPEGSKVADVLEYVEALQAQLEQIEELLEEYGQDFVKWPNGRKIKGPGERLRAMFESGRWLEYDL